MSSSKKGSFPIEKITSQRLCTAYSAASRLSSLRLFFRISRRKSSLIVGLFTRVNQDGKTIGWECGRISVPAPLVNCLKSIFTNTLFVFKNTRALANQVFQHTNCTYVSWKSSTVFPDERGTRIIAKPDSPKT